MKGIRRRTVLRRFIHFTAIKDEIIKFRWKTVHLNSMRHMNEHKSAAGSLKLGSTKFSAKLLKRDYFFFARRRLGLSARAHKCSLNLFFCVSMPCFVLFKFLWNFWSTDSEVWINFTSDGSKILIIWRYFKVGINSCKLVTSKTQSERFAISPATDEL